MSICGGNPGALSFAVITIKEAYSDRLKMKYFANSFRKDEVKSWLEANGFSTATIERISVK